MVAYPWPDKSANKVHDEQVGEQMKVRMARAKIAPAGLIAVALALTSAAVGLVAAPAGAAPSTKYFTDSVGSSDTTLSSTVVYPVTSTGPLYLRIRNATDSNQSFGSADVDLLNDWSWKVVQITTSNAFASHWSSVTDSNKHVIHLRNDGTGSQYSIAPGGWLQLQLTFSSPTGGIYVPTFVVKQSNDFSDSSTRGTSNVFIQRTPAAAIYIGSGPPAKLVYTQGPTDVQMTSTATGTHYMCPPVTAAVEDATNNVVSWLPATAVTLSSTGSPGLKLDGSTTLSANTVSGVATFGAGNTTDGCTAGLTATTQGSYALTASTTWAAGAGYASKSVSTSAVDYNVFLTPCDPPSCNVDLPPGHDTSVNIVGTGTTTNPLVGFISASSLPSGCDTSIAYRPEETTFLLENHDKTITVAWSKKVTNQDPRNGTPFWPVCLQAPYSVYVNDTPTHAALADATDGAMLALCSTTGVGHRGDGNPDAPCILDLYKNAASEHAILWLPNIAGDPHFI
jgi:hypothetical protein